MSNILIAYYSWSGNTRKIARLIREETGGTLCEIVPAQAYPSAYNACTAQAKKEIREGHLPPLLALPENLDGFDTVLVGTPNWWSTLAPPVASFLATVDLTGKTVAPFCTHGGGGQARCASDTAKACSGSNITEGLAVYGDGGGKTQLDVAAWLRRIGVNR